MSLAFIYLCNSASPGKVYDGTQTGKLIAMARSVICNIVNILILLMIWNVFLCLIYLYVTSSIWVVAVLSIPAMVLAGYIEERLVSPKVNALIMPRKNNNKRDCHKLERYE